MLALKTSLFHSEVYIALISFNQKLKRQNAPFSLHQSASTDNMSTRFHVDPTLISRGAAGREQLFHVLH